MEAPAIDAARCTQTVLIALAVFLVTSAGIIGLWIATAAQTRRDFRDHLTDLAIAAAQQVDPGLHASLRDPSQLNGPDYQRAIKPLRRMRLALPGVRYIYTMVRTPDGSVHFVLDAADPGDRDGVASRTSPASGRSTPIPIPRCPWPWVMATRPDTRQPPGNPSPTSGAAS